MEKVKKAMGPIPGGTVKDSGDRDKAPVVFGTVMVDSNNNFGVVDDRDVHPGYSIPWNTIRLHAFEQNGFVGLFIHGYYNPK